METEINGKKVVFRDKFPARFGWGLLGAVARIGDYQRQYVVKDENGEPELDDDGRMKLTPDTPSFISILSSVLTFDEITQFIRGAVESWDFDGDLSKDSACENLDTVSELWEIATQAVNLFNSANTLGEADGLPTSESAS